MLKGWLKLFNSERMSNKYYSKNKDTLKNFYFLISFMLVFTATLLLRADIKYNIYCYFNNCPKSPFLAPYYFIFWTLCLILAYIILKNNSG